MQYTKGEGRRRTTPAAQQSINQIKMKKVTKQSSMTKGSVVGKLLTPTLTLVAAAVAVLPAYRASADEFNLSGAPTTQSVSVAGEFGGTVIFQDQWSQP